MLKAAIDSLRATPDRIVGFDFGAELIDLSALDANLIAACNQAFTFHASKAGVFAAGSLCTEAGGGGVKICADLNGDGKADFMLAVYAIGNPYSAEFHASDFIL